MKPCLQHDGCNTEIAAPVNEKTQALDRLHRLLRYEGLSWLIGGIVSIAQYFWLLFNLYMYATTDQVTLEALTVSQFVIFAAICTAFLSSPAIILQLVMAKKAQRYANGLRKEWRPVIKRCSSIGIIVLAAFFNHIALVFAIISYCHVKNNIAFAKYNRKKED